MLFLSLHAVKQMRRRGISRDEVAEALGAVETTFPSADAPEDRLVVFGRTRAGRPLKLVVLADDTHYVVTVARRDDDG